MPKRKEHIYSKAHWEELRSGHIVGICDAYGAVESRLSQSVEIHLEHWPNAPRCRWRWTFSNSIDATIGGRPTGEEMDLIRGHLTKKYGIQWFDNGYHDIDHFLKNLGRSGFRPGF